ncbi:hypothetical protein DPMN_081531 [Dreissena polymorpha]|uniref:RCHY1 zinc-ribbon domain-containing protein n=1 Tax=Dreissena polymorpha TaxID=45954 RepID=A0A9D3Y6H7_DREPO|nr:hypothetical protein DPMN_081531 [Dreissena polymorpha]
MKQAWKILDQEVANTPMPDEYKDYHVTILCRDCHQVRSLYIESEFLCSPPL